MDSKERSAELLQEMKWTKGSRFNAAERLRRRDRGRTYITSAASVSVIILTVFPLLFHVPDVVTAAVNFMTITMSIVILVYSLIQYSSGDLVAADQHHRCAMEIGSLRRELRGIEVVDSGSISLFSMKYDAILQKYSINHDPIDFKAYKAEHQDEFRGENKEDKQLKKEIKIERRTESLLGSSITVVIISMVSFVILYSVYTYINQIKSDSILSGLKDEQQMLQQRNLEIQRMNAEEELKKLQENYNRDVRQPSGKTR